MKLPQWVRPHSQQLLETLALLQDIPSAVVPAQPWPGHIPRGAIQPWRASGIARGCLAPSKEPVLSECLCRADSGVLINRALAVYLQPYEQGHGASLAAIYMYPREFKECRQNTMQLL